MCVYPYICICIYVDVIYMHNKRVEIPYAFTFFGEKTLHYISVFGQFFWAKKHTI